jgi:hypothetical protein
MGKPPSKALATVDKASPTRDRPAGLEENVQAIKAMGERVGKR